MTEPLNIDLIGMDDGVMMLDTPALILDQKRFETNLNTLMTRCHEQGVHLRPHAKTHKSVNVAKRQLELGAVGVCCAKLGEAEALAGGGINNILLTSPVVTERAFSRLVDLLDQGTDIQAVIDSPTIAAELSRYAKKRGQKVEVLVDVDPGMHRTGIAFEDAASLVETVENLPNLNFGGLQVYAGNLMHIGSYDERRSRDRQLTERIAELKQDLEKRGFAVPRVSGGGTGTFDMDIGGGVFTELQAGSYAFMDVQYQDIQYADSSPFLTSLFVATRVISISTPGLATTDGGFKAFATDDCNPQLRDYESVQVDYRFMGDEHGALISLDQSIQFNVADLVFAVTPHCDPTFNLYDHVHVVEGSRLVDIWNIEARGKTA